LAKSKPIVQTPVVMPVSNGDANHPSLPHIGIVAGVYIINAVANLHNCPRHAMSSSDDRALRSEAMAARREIAEPGVAA